MVTLPVIHDQKLCSSNISPFAQHCGQFSHIRGSVESALLYRTGKVGESFGKFLGRAARPGPCNVHKTTVQPGSCMSEVQREALQGSMYSIVGKSHVDRLREECNVRGLERSYSHPAGRPPLVLLHKHSTWQRKPKRIDCLSHFQVKSGCQSHPMDCQVYAR